MACSKFWFPLLIVLPLLAACGSEDEKPKPGCSLTGATGCEADKVCEEVKGGDPQCFAPVTLKGSVSNALDASPIAGAHVVARDVNGVAVSSVAVSDDAGKY